MFPNRLIGRRKIYLHAAFMGSMKTILVATALASALTGPLQALENNALQTFATCVGRLSAVMEHQWMFDGPASDRTKVQRAHLLDLVEAVMEPQQAAEVLHWRISGKQAQSVLLTRSVFNSDADDAAWARAMALDFEQSCTGLLLS